MTDREKPVILAVDDQPVILHAVAAELRGSYQVKPFTSGRAALQFLERNNVNLILLDYDMPEINGREMLEHLRKGERTAHVPVIFLTGSEDDDTEVEVLERGASDYIQKPIKAHVLQTRVRMQLELASYRSHLETLVDEKTEHLRLANDKLKVREEVTLSLLAEVTDLRDHDTGGHVERTTEMVRVLTEDILKDNRSPYTLTEDAAEDIIKSARLHDLGKIAVPDRILLKPGRLSHEEFEIIHLHPIHGAGLLDKYISRLGEDSFLDTARDIALCHHEKWDGSGYPTGLTGESIPLSARITAIADVYDALTSVRPYKESYPHEEAVEIIASDRETHFDPYLVDIFLKHEKDFYDVANSTFTERRETMNITPQQTEKLLSGNYNFTQLGFSMMLTRLKGVYAKDPSPATVQTCAREINVFLEKFHTIMSSDFHIIADL